VCGGVAIAIGVAIVLGWALDAGVLTSIVPSLPAATFNSALMFVAAGIALAASRRPALGFGCAAFVFALACATLVEEAAGADLGVDNPLGFDFDGMVHPGRPSTHTAAAFALLGACLLVRTWRTPRGDFIAGVLGAGAAASVALAVAGYLVGVDYLLGRSDAHGMSVHTAVGLIFVLVGTFALRPQAPPAAWYASSGPGEAAARSLMVPGLVVPFAAAALAQAGASAGLYSDRFALSVMVVMVAALIQAMILRAVHAVREHDAARARLEHENLQNIQRFAALTREAPVGIFETDAEGRPTFVNEHWVELAGISAPDTYAGRSAVHPDDRDWVRAQWRAASEAGRGYDAEFRFQRPDGDVRWVAVRGTPLRDVQGEVTGYMGSVLDITDRRAAEQRTERVVSRIAEAVSVIGPDGRRLHANDAAQAILSDLLDPADEASLSELRWELVDEHGRTVANDALPAEISRTTGVEIDDRVLGFRGKSGERRWLRISTRRLSDEGPPFAVVTSFSDVTAEREDAARLAEAQRRFQLAFDHAPIGVNVVSLEGKLLQVNRALCEIIGYTEDEMLATTFQELSSENDLGEDVEQLRKLVAGEIPAYQMEKRYRHKNGSEVWALVSVSLMRDEDGKPLHFIGQILDVTERRRLERELRHQAEHDNLTGVCNRRAFNRHLGRELVRERRYGGESCLLMIDLDGFKEINDTIGHGAGDEVLRAVADTISERIRDTDVAARLGGDEFAILLPNTDRQGGEILAIDLVQAIRELRVEVGSDEPAGVTASVGVACSAELPEGRDEDALLVAADLAMYDAKRTGRDGYAVHHGQG
jgi:diguanylate cyclase (GGDEF)-like protein/PAS domain S-box-containing protein